MGIAVRTTNLDVFIDKKKIINAVDISVEEGEFVSIVGANGSGKSTLIKSICGINSKIKGHIAVFDKDITDYKRTDLAKKISYVAQFNAIPEFSVYEFIIMSRYPYFNAFSSVSAEDIEAVTLSMEITGISDLKERRMSCLSGGERQRVIIASAIAQSSDIILLDEPTTYLDPKYQEEIHSLIYDIHKSMKKTVINVTHDLNSAIRYSDKIIALQNGHSVFIGDSNEFVRRDIPELIFNTKFITVNHPANGSKYLIPNYGK